MTQDKKVPGADRASWENSWRARARRALLSLPLVGPFAVRLHSLLLRPDANRYWEKRYRKGGDSGSGSYSRLAQFKAEVVNETVKEHYVSFVIEFGCGDGSQLQLAEYPRYLGLDVAPSAIARCRQTYAGDQSKEFQVFTPGLVVPQGDLTLSLDVVFHLIDDKIFDGYMTALFSASRRLVIVYSSNFEERYAAPHVRHRKFTDWVEQNQPDFSLIRTVSNRYPFQEGDPDSSYADFFIYQRRDS